MKTIIQFLRNQYTTNSGGIENIDDKNHDVENLKTLFLNNEKVDNHKRNLNITPHAQRNQIWTVKNEYIDKLGLKQKASHPFLVFINSDLKEIDGENFIRVLIVSPFVEFASKIDKVCDDPSIIGFPFLIETWNDQPMLTDLLNEYVGSYSISSSISNSKFEDINSSVENLTEDQKEFRNLEISNAKYLSHSVLSLLSFLENRSKKLPIIGGGKVFRMFKTLSSVAAIIVIIFSVYKYNNQDEELKFSNFENNSIVLLGYLEPTKANLDIQDNSRGQELNYQGFTQFETQIIVNAKSKALEGNYSDAIKDLEKIDSLDRSSELSLMISLIYLNVENYESSIQILEKVNSKNISNNKESIIYYLGLSYALNGENNKAKSQLKKLKGSDSNYAILAERLFEIL